jgi:hypothetical protein
MAKVVRAFSIDREVADRVDLIAKKNSTWDRKPNASRVVNDALRWYYTDTNIADIIADREELIEFHRKRADGWASRGGVKHHLAGLLRCLNPFLRQKRE